MKIEFLIIFVIGLLNTYCYFLECVCVNAAYKLHMKTKVSFVWYVFSFSLGYIFCITVVPFARVLNTEILNLLLNTEISSLCT